MKPKALIFCPRCKGTGHWVSEGFTTTTTDRCPTCKGAEVIEWPVKQVFLVQDDREFDPEIAHLPQTDDHGRSWGVGIYDLETQELIIREYGPSPISAEVRAEEEAESRGYEIVPIPDDFFE